MMSSYSREPDAEPVLEGWWLSVGGEAGSRPDDLGNDPLEIIRRTELDDNPTALLPHLDLDTCGELLGEDLFDLGHDRVGRRRRGRWCDRSLTRRRLDVLPNEY